MSSWLTYLIQRAEPLSNLLPATETMFWNALQKWKDGFSQSSFLKVAATMFASSVYINWMIIPCPKKICKNREKSM